MKVEPLMNYNEILSSNAFNAGGKGIKQEPKKKKSIKLRIRRNLKMEILFPFQQFLKQSSMDSPKCFHLLIPPHSPHSAPGY